MQGLTDSNRHRLLTVKGTLCSEVESALFLKSQQITLTIKLNPYINIQKTENVVLLLMPFYKRWNLLFTRHLTMNVDIMHGSLEKTTKNLTSLNLAVQHHSFQFFAKLLRIHRMPPINSDEYFYTLIEFLASPQCLNIA